MADSSGQRILILGGSGFLSGTLAQRSETTPFLCHRIYDLSKPRAAGASAPDTPLRSGLAKHVASPLA